LFDFWAQYFGEDMINSLDFEKIRSQCKIMIENLETWLRNIIDIGLTAKYGANFQDYRDENGIRLLSNRIIKEANLRYTSEPDRYPRFVDSLLLDDIVKIVCKHDIYKSTTEDYLKYAFPEGNSEALTFLNRLIPIRNKLYHSNPITNHEALRALCYSNDVISSIKLGYKEKNLDKEYNAPTIIRVEDLFGNQFNQTQIRRNSTGRGCCDTRKNGTTVYVGEKINIQVEVDPSFSIDDYTINWIFDKKEESAYAEIGNRIELSVENKHVRTDFAIYCCIKSIEKWHRCGDVDDCVSILYEIIPMK
jgi:hypothetical protein